MTFSRRTGRWLGRLLLLCLSLSAFTAAARSGGDLAWREARSLPELVAQLETWLDAQTDLPRRAQAPRIDLVGTGEAALLVSARTGADRSTLRGLYDPDLQTIWLVRPWDPRDPFDVSALLHELVHHRQGGFGFWYCPGAQELPAYRLQRDWLAEMGLEPDVNWIAVVLEAGCTPRDIHPD